MGERTGIAWTDHTFNPWIGCQKIAAGCLNCYAEKETRPRVLRSRGIETWGPKGQRVVTSDAYWKQPLKWNRQAEEDGVRRRVFCGSMCDVFEARDDLIHARARLATLIEKTPALDWLLLTKRPENAWRFWPWIKSDGTDSGERDEWYPPNVWLGTSASTQKDLNRNVPHLLRCPASVRFMSLEPLIEAVDLFRTFDGMVLDHPESPDWVIVGGESGVRARPCRIDWIRLVVSQCRAAGVACFVKQMGSRFIGWEAKYLEDPERPDAKGGNPEEWPEDLRVREFPR
jgi:protein gp37